MNITKKEFDDYIVYIRDNDLGIDFQSFIESFIDGDCKIPPSAHVLKDGRSTFVWKVSGKKAKLKSDIIIKGFKPRGFIHILARLFGDMRGERVFSNLSEIVSKTNAITAPLAYMVRSAVSADLVIFKYAEGENLADICLKDDFEEDSDLSIELARHFAEVLAGFHRVALTHGDLKWSNIIVGNDKSFTFVDLDNARSHKHFNKSAVMKDLMRFYRYGFEIDKLQFTEVFFEQYFEIIKESIPHNDMEYLSLENIKGKVAALKPEKRFN